MIRRTLFAVVATMALLSFGPRAQANLIYQFHPTSLFGAIASEDYHPQATFTDGFGPVAFNTQCSFGSPALCSTFTGDTNRYVSSSFDSFGHGLFTVNLELGPMLTGTWAEDGLQQN